VRNEGAIRCPLESVNTNSAECGPLDATICYGGGVHSHE
jgi:hypothetical protein